jgi:hypothetical protein
VDAAAGGWFNRSMSPLNAHTHDESVAPAPPAPHSAHGGESAFAQLARTAGNKAVADLVGEASIQRSPVLETISRPGRPLEPELRSKMESELGHDFSSVRIHDDHQAADSAAAVQAAAYTAGENIVLGQGTTLQRAGGHRLLKEELVHVVQQRQGPVDGTPAPGGIKLSDPSDRFERQAQRIASGGDAGELAEGSAA